MLYFRVLGLTKFRTSYGIIFNDFAKLTRVPNTQTDTQTTLRATSVAMGRIYALRAGDTA